MLRVHASKGSVLHRFIYKERWTVADSDARVARSHIS